MVDNGTSGYFGIGGAFNFKSGDISGTAAKTSDDRQSQGMDYLQQQQKEQNQEEKEQHVDRSAQLNATLNSLAMNNIATILHNINKPKDMNNFIKKQNKESQNQKKEQSKEDKKENLDG